MIFQSNIGSLLTTVSIFMLVAILSRKLRIYAFRFARNVANRWTFALAAGLLTFGIGLVIGKDFLFFSFVPLILVIVITVFQSYRKKSL